MVASSAHHGIQKEVHCCNETEYFNLSCICIKVWGPFVVTLLNWTLVFEWCMTRLVVNNKHQQDFCYNEIGMCAQNEDIISSHLQLLSYLMRMD